MASGKLVILFVTVEDNWIGDSLVLFVLGDGPEEVRIVLPVVTGDTPLGAVADNHSPENHHDI